MSDGEADNQKPSDGSAVQPMKLIGGKSQSIEELFDEAVRTHSRRLLSIARGIVGYRASPEDIASRAISHSSLW